MLNSDLKRKFVTVYSRNKTEPHFFEIARDLLADNRTNEDFKVGQANKDWEVESGGLGGFRETQGDLGYRAETRRVQENQPKLKCPGGRHSGANRGPAPSAHPLQGQQSNFEN